MRGQVKQIAQDIRDGKPISFGGEYGFNATDTYAEALDRLYKTGCEIGGTVSGNGNTIKVFPCHDAGYWSFEWLMPDQGVRHIRYWTAECVSDDLWDEKSAKLMESISGRNPLLPKTGEAA